MLCWRAGEGMERRTREVAGVGTPCPRPIAVAVALIALAGAARAADPPPADEDPLAAARRAYFDGVERVKRAEWAEALMAFEQSAKLRPNAGTTFNIGVCERAVGHYLRARDAFSRALAEDAASKNQLTADQISDAGAFLSEIEQLLAHLQVHVDPPETEIAVDGRPLEVTRAGAAVVLVAGTLPAGRGAAPPVPDFELVAEPGQHVFVLARKGYMNAVVQRRFEPGAHAALALEITRLAATIRVTAARPGAVVTVDDLDAGQAPIELSRPAGSYRVTVRKRGFVAYQTRVTVQPGEQVDLQAPLPPEQPIYKRWWLWSSAVVLVGAVLGVSLGLGLNQPPPPYDEGNTHWLATPLRLR